MKATATLVDVRRTRTFSDPCREILTGVIYGDTQHRFGDGERIHTSYIVREVEPDLFETRSGSLYRVKNWLPEHREH